MTNSEVTDATASNAAVSPADDDVDVFADPTELPTELPAAFAALAAFDDPATAAAAARFHLVELRPNRALTDEEAERKHRAAVERGALCQQCPMYGSGLGPVMGEIRPGSRLCAVAEAPGEKEVLQGRPLVGWTGKQTRSALRAGGLEEPDISLTNTILCRPPDELSFEAHISVLKLEHKRAHRAFAKRAVVTAWAGASGPLDAASAVLSGAQSGLWATAPFPATLLLPTQACRPRLVHDLEEAKASNVMTLGGQALAAVTEVLGIRSSVGSLQRQHNAPVDLKPLGSPMGAEWLHVCYHPSFAGKDKREWFGTIIQGIVRGAQITTGGQEWQWPPPEQVNTDPTPDQIIEFCRRVRLQKAWLVVDIETSSLDRRHCFLRRVGLGAELDGKEEVMVVPFRHMDGKPWWEPHDVQRIGRAMREMFDDPNVELIGHNAASFDASVLIHKRLLSARNKHIWDTAVMHHDTSDNDLMHDLGFVTKRVGDVSLWKSDVDHKSVDNVDDPVLSAYCAKDVVAELRDFNALYERIDEEGNWSYYKTDHAIGPVLREAGDLGLVIDERQRGHFSQQLNWQTQRELYRWREHAGFVNPRSVPDLQELIYNDWGYKPVVVSEEAGFEIDEEAEAGSTSSGALIELMRSQDVSADHRAALNVLLEFRAFDKLRGTYVDGLHMNPLDSFGAELPAVHALQWNFENGEYKEAETIAPRREFSRLFTTYLNFVVPTGRKSTKPAVQNWPSIGKINTRAMVVAPPGHKIIIADYAQLEARIYAVIAHDQLLLRAFAEGKDIHSMNAASLLAKNVGEIDEWYKRIEYGPNGKAKDKKWTDASGENTDAISRSYWRTVAKRFCIAEGQRVLTDRGCVPIEQVRRTDRVWGGCEWVHHDGVIYQGVQEVITHDGLTATPDHKVWVEDGRKVQLGYAAICSLRLLQSGDGDRPVDVSRQLSTVDKLYATADASIHDRKEVQPRARDNHRRRYKKRCTVSRRARSAARRAAAARTRAGRDAIRSLGDTRTRMAVERPPTGPCPVCGRSRRSAVPDPASRVLRQPGRAEVDCMPLVRAPEASAGVAQEPYERGTTTLPKPKRFALHKLRRSWYRIPLQERARRGRVGLRQPWAAARYVSRPDRQRWALRAREPVLEQWLYQCHEQAECCDACRLEVLSGRVAIHAARCRKKGSSRYDPSRNPCGRSLLHRRARATLAPRKSAARAARRMRVYDLLNAGPRHRFTVENRVSGNCFLEIYGGEEGKLYSVVAGLRKKDGSGELEFPNLKMDDVHEWHENWHFLHPETQRWHANVHKFIRQHGYVEVPFLNRRRRYFPYGLSKKNAGPNMQIQGAGASIADRGLLQFAEAVPFYSLSDWTGLFLQVHDCLGAYVPAAHAERLANVLAECMSFEFGGVKFPAEALVIDRWSKEK